MTLSARSYVASFCVSLCLISAPSAALADAGSGFGRERTLRAASAEQVGAALQQWLSAKNATPEVTAEIGLIWNASPTISSDTLDRLSKTFALVDERAKALRDVTLLPDAASHLPDVGWLASDDVQPFERDNLRLWYGRWLTQRELYDEASTMLTDLEPAKVVDPASLLVHQAVVHQRLLAKEEGLKAVDALLDQVDGAPKRYVKLAELLRADLQGIEDESLDHVARRMENIERHLDQGRADEKVQGIEDGVIASLDKMIKELEDKAQSQSQSQSSGQSQGGKNSGQAQGVKPGGNPADQSTPAQGRGPGEVDPKDLGDSDGWGNLPPKAREEAMQQIGQDFPAHYRDVIEQYFRKLADEGREN